MQIHGLGQVHGPQPTNAPHRATATASGTSASNYQPTGVDQLDISPEADLVSRVRDLPDIRQDLVARIRGQIEAGTYETDDKLDIAVGRLLDEFGG